jgi:SAM-dependent methyltransferase
VNEFNRVLKPGGYVGLNEETWLKTPPAGHVEAASAVWEIESEILTIDGWRDLLEEAGLHDVEVRNYKVDARRESSQVRRYSWRDMWRMFSRTLALYFKSTEFREYLQGRFRLPKDVFQYLGYGLFVGRKPDGR